jgi:endonuclease YncB( thermonuclease family)
VKKNVLKYRYGEANNYVMKSRQTVGKEMVENGYPSKQKKTEGSNTRIYEGLRWKYGIYDGEL